LWEVVNCAVEGSTSIPHTGSLCLGCDGLPAGFRLSMMG
jgi:hypothetical protein